MISVLIPVFNSDVHFLVQTISRQLSNLDQPGEVLVLDDGSTQPFKNINRSIHSLPHVTYNELEQNTGRVKIRFDLASRAQYPFLIFIDGDSRIESQDFLSRYAAVMQQHEVVAGGRSYQPAQPERCNLRLHWKYGRERENIIERKSGFLTNNFCIHKNTFLQFDSTQTWPGYGHEDTWMGIQLEQLNVAVHYLNNPVWHEGLEEADQFIEKSIEALHSLVRLSRLYKPDLVRKHVRLYDVYCKLQSARLIKPVRMFYQHRKAFMERNLKSCNPSLTLFDLYRLGKFIELYHVKSEP